MTLCPLCSRPCPAVRTKRSREPRFRLEGVVCPEHGYRQIAEEREWHAMNEDFK